MKDPAAMDRILVTGGAGFIGSHVVEFYSRKGVEVVALDNLSRTPPGDSIHGFSNWDFLATLPGVERVLGDVRDSSILADLVRDVDAIIHTAGQVAVTTSLRDPRMDFEVNALGTLNVLEAARRRGDAALVFCSTNKVYGGNVNRLPVAESESRYSFADGLAGRGVPTDFPIDGCEHTPYGTSKLAADLYVQDYAHLYGLPAACFRMSCIYGTRQFGNEDQGWVAHFILSALEGRPITIYGDGKQVRDVLYADDLVRAYDAYLTRAKSLGGRVFNIGGGPNNTLSLLELLAMLQTLTGRRPPLSFGPWRPSDQLVYISDLGRVREDLGWEPTVSPREGIVQFLKWYSQLR